MASVEQVGHFCDGLVWFLVVLVVGGFYQSSFCFGSGMCSLFDFYMVMGCSSFSLSLSLSLSLVKVIIASGIVGMNRVHGSLVRCV